jgi:hypothetical protein
MSSANRSIRSGSDTVLLHPASAQDQQLPWSILRWEGITDELLAKRALHMA